ncbi:MAG: nitroreductase family protein [Candidatus Promineifilaceae bacterium]|nr:nitroreductase family protein [Candidatus Promineifilaceae bacterium]
MTTKSENNNPVYQAIKSRRAVRQFAPDPIPRQQIEQLIHTGRLSASAKNRQPWQFIVVTERDTLRELSTCGPWCGHLAGAAFAVVLTAEDLHEPPTLTTPFDLGRAGQNMILAAWEMGIMSCLATIYEPDQARAILAIPGDRAVPWAISFGYPTAESDPRSRPPRKSGRKELDEILHWERW